MASSPAQPVPPASSPVPTGWDEYLSELGLTRAEQQELDSGKLSLDAFVDRKAREEARVNAAFYRGENTEGNTDLEIFINYMDQAIEQLIRHPEDRCMILPPIPGVPEALLIEWAEEHIAERDARQRQIWEAEQEAERQKEEELRTRLSTILEDEEYEPED